MATVTSGLPAASNASVDMFFATRPRISPEAARETRSDIGLQLAVARCPLRPDNTRIYYVPREDEALKQRVVRALEAGPGAIVTLTGDAADAYSGQIIAFVLPLAGFVGFAQLPEPDTQVGGSCEPSLASARVVKAFKAVPAKSFDAFKGLFCNPSILSVPFGKKVSELRDQVALQPRVHKWPYSPESANEVLHKLWLDAGGSYASALPRRKRAAGNHTSNEDAPRRKAPNREMQGLNEPILLEQLRTVGFSQERAQEVLQQQSNRGWSFYTNSVGEEHEFQIWKLKASAPSVTGTELPRLYNKLALLWKEELERPKRRAAPRSRNTRFQERAAADREERVKTQGLSEIQLQQVRDAVREAIKPLADQQQQQGARVEAVAAGYAGLNNTCNQLQQIMPALSAISIDYSKWVLGPGGAMPAAGTV